MSPAFQQVLYAVGVVFAASIGCSALEQAGALHPKVRIGLQVGVIGLAGLVLGRMVGAL